MARLTTRLDTLERHLRPFPSGGDDEPILSSDEVVRRRVVIREITGEDLTSLAERFHTARSAAEQTVVLRSWSDRELVLAGLVMGQTGILHAHYGRLVGVLTEREREALLVACEGWDVS